MAHKLSDLHRLTVVTERGTSLSSLTPPSLTSLLIRQYDHDWLEMFNGATLERLETVSFSSKSEEIGHFLGAFELRTALAASVQNTLSNFSLYKRCSRNPELSSLLSFTEMKALSASALGVRFPCDNGCSSSSRVDDDGLRFGKILTVGEILIPEQPVLMVSLTLVRIFPPDRSPLL